MCHWAQTQNENANSGSPAQQKCTQIAHHGAAGGKIVRRAPGRCRNHQTIPPHPAHAGAVRLHQSLHKNLNTRTSLSIALQVSTLRRDGRQLVFRGSIARHEWTATASHQRTQGSHEQAIHCNVHSMHTKFHRLTALSTAHSFSTYVTIWTCTTQAHIHTHTHTHTRFRSVSVAKHTHGSDALFSLILSTGASVAAAHTPHPRQPPHIACACAGCTKRLPCAHIEAG